MLLVYSPDKCWVIVCKSTASELNPIQQRKSDDLQVPNGREILVVIVVGWAYLLDWFGGYPSRPFMCHFSTTTKREPPPPPMPLSSTHAYNASVARYRYSGSGLSEATAAGLRNEMVMVGYGY